MGFVNCNNFDDELEIKPNQQESGSSCSRRATAGKLGRTTDNDHQDNTKFKSKNLEAERRRRERIKTRLLILRASVPIITNMNKDTILTDAATYIGKLQRQVQELEDQLLDLDAAPEEETEPQTYDKKDVIDNAAEEMLNIEPQVNVILMEDNKLWIKVIYQNEKNHRGFTYLVAGLSELGYEFNDISLSTVKGAAVLSACLEGIYGPSDISAQEMNDKLLDVISNL